MRAQVSHPYKTTGKFRVLYIQKITTAKIFGNHVKKSYFFNKYYTQNINGTSKMVDNRSVFFTSIKDASILIRSNGSEEGTSLRTSISSVPKINVKQEPELKQNVYSYLNLCYSQIFNFFSYTVLHLCFSLIKVYFINCQNIPR
jgi:hypothetical protein